MKFSQHRKTLKLEHIDTLKIDLDLIKCQYNPDYEKAWIKVCGGSYNINSTPYYHYLKYRSVNKYEELMELYGRSKVWITNNILKYFRLIESIDSDGIQEPPVVLTRPIIENQYNSGLEIWEGHRRLSVCVYKQIEPDVKLCRVLKS